MVRFTRVGPRAGLRGKGPAPAGRNIPGCDQVETLAKRELFPGRWQIAALLFLPLVLLAVGKDWIFPSLTHDPWIYLGYGLDTCRMLAKFGNKYYSSRLSIILPVAAAHKLMPPVPAHLLIHFSLYYVSVFCTYDLVGGELGYRAGFLTALTLGTSFFFLEAIGRDYYDSFGIAYLLASMWLMSKSRGGRYGALWAVASGACSAALTTSYLAHLIFVPFVLLGYLLLRGRDRGVAGVLVDVAAFVVGALALAAVFCLVSRETMGDPWFLGPSLAFVRYTMKAG